MRALTVSSRQPYLFSAGEDKQVKCWDLEYNKVGERESEPVNACACACACTCVCDVGECVVHVCVCMHGVHVCVFVEHD